jgi:hypothetical protein
MHSLCTHLALDFLVVRLVESLELLLGEKLFDEPPASRGIGFAWLAHDRSPFSSQGQLRRGGILVERGGVTVPVTRGELTSGMDRSCRGRVRSSSCPLSPQIYGGVFL